MGYKLKSHSGAAKRFKKTASGGFKRKQSHLRHILTKKSSKRKAHLRPRQWFIKMTMVLFHVCYHSLNRGFLKWQELNAVLSHVNVTRKY